MHIHRSNLLLLVTILFCLSCKSLQTANSEQVETYTIGQSDRLMLLAYQMRADSTYFPVEARLSYIHFSDAPAKSGCDTSEGMEGDLYIRLLDADGNTQLRCFHRNPHKRDMESAELSGQLTFQHIRLIDTEIALRIPLKEAPKSVSLERIGPDGQAPITLHRFLVQ